MQKYKSYADRQSSPILGNSIWVHIVIISRSIGHFLEEICQWVGPGSSFYHVSRVNSVTNAFLECGQHFTTDVIVF